MNGENKALPRSSGLADELKELIFPAGDPPGRDYTLVQGGLIFENLRVQADRECEKC